MRLGIHVNTGRHMKELVSISRSAVKKGHEVSVFITGEGVGLLLQKDIDELAGIDGVDVVFCDFNAMQMDIPRESLPDALRAGSQLDNAIMVRDTDRVITL